MVHAMPGLLRYGASDWNTAQTVMMADAVAMTVVGTGAGVSVRLQGAPEAIRRCSIR